MTLSKKNYIQEYKNIFAIFSVIPASLRRKILFQQFLSSISSVAEVISISAIVPIISFAVNQQQLYTLPIFGSINISSVVLLFLVAAVVSTFLRLYVVWNNLIIGSDIGSCISKQLFSNYIHQNLSYQRNNHSGKIISSLTYKVSNVVGVFSSILNINTSIISILFVASAISFMNPIVVLSMVGIIVIYYYLLSRLARKKVSEYGLLSLKSDKSKIKNIQEAFESYREITILSAQDRFINQHYIYEYDQRSSWSKSNFIAAMPKYGAELIMIFVIIAFFYILSNQSISNIASLGAIIFGFQKIVPQAQQLFNSWATIKSNVHVLQDVCNDLIILDQKPKYNDLTTSQKFEQCLELSSIKFSHGKKVVYDNLNIKICKGDKIGVIGKTGKGKSTLIDLICGFVTPDHGMMLVDNKIMQLENSERLCSWRNNIALVQQKNYVTSDSILNNIVSNSYIIDPIKIRHVVKAAQLTDLIDSLPNGLHSQVGERGCLLSGGQIQRICIARALYLDRELLILDEATSALDTLTEKTIIENVLNLYESRTVIVVTHKPHILKSCNKIIDLNNNPNSFQ